ncbi:MULTISPECIES: ATP-dependent helicase C-terminal domain-containing protein [Nocardioides]|uniref:ATP-dependent helicase C-terminal domain-containing protein n=1 Tax=Nocardioides vastitatis TaxID=2568655 RepID=A0ABW0ZHN3_9ACTN|nr:ATP-dependent helicase C-terminal domain-containing protein [Nocardioides sp.]
MAASVHARRAIPSVTACAGGSLSLDFLHRALGDPWPDVSDEALTQDLQSWLGPQLARVHSAQDLRRIDVTAALRAMVPWPEAGRLNDLAPERVEVPNGSSVRIDYSQDQPVLAERLQEVFGWTAVPSDTESGSRREFDRGDAVEETVDQAVAAPPGVLFDGGRVSYQSVDIGSHCDGRGRTAVAEPSGEHRAGELGMEYHCQVASYDERLRSRRVRGQLTRPRRQGPRSKSRPQKARSPQCSPAGGLGHHSGRNQRRAPPLRD